jgi:hypothetical protein
MEDAGQALQSPGWGRKERVAHVVEILRQKRMVAYLVHEIVSAFGECPPDRHAGEACKEQAGCEACWVRWAERAVQAEWSEKQAQREEISPKEQPKG